MTSKLKTLIASTLTLAAASAVMAQGVPADDPKALWRDVSKSVDERARDLLARLSLEEKIALLHADGTFSSAGVPRLGIPKLWMSDGPQGVREEIQASGWNPANRTDDFATAMPASIALAASFDVELAKAYGTVIGEEALTRGKNIILGPGFNIMRSPLNGRNSEYYGEDPYLAGRIAVGFINGLQAQGVAACVKHYALNNQETNRNTVNAKADERTMREIYLAPFKMAVVEGKAWAVMTGYNRVNGQYCAENDFLLNQVLKRDWGFPGIVMSDWGGTHSTVASAMNGLDLEMGSNVTGNHNNDYLAAPLLAAVQAGQVPMARIDEMALRNLRVMAATGNLDPAGSRPKGKGLMTPEHIETARKIGEAGIVLLKNERQVLPLNPVSIKSIAVIGDNAKAKFAYDGDSARIKTSYEITPLEGITKRAGEGVKITYAQGYARPAAAGRGGPGRGARGAAAPAAPNNQALIDEAVAAAKAADVAIVVAGLYRNQDQEGRDRPNMNLPPGQEELIQAVIAANPKTVVILNGGSPSVVTPWVDKTAGLLMYWYGGTEGGNALARVLYGDANPSAKLPTTWAKQLTDISAHAPENQTAAPAGAPAGRGPGAPGGGRGPLAPDAGPQVEYKDGIFVGYRWFDQKKIEPQFPFGFGLSYTTFALSNARAEMISNAADASPKGLHISVTCELTNTGSRVGAEVVQVYVTQNNPTVPRAPRELKGFAKMEVKPGEKVAVKIPLELSALTHFDVEKQAWIAEAGEYTLSIGTSSRQLPLQATIRLPQTVTIKENGGK